MGDQYQISKYDHGLGHGSKPTWVVYDREGDIRGGPDRTGGWANSFRTRADAEHACAHLNGHRTRARRRRRRR